MSIKLREYQEECVEIIHDHFKENDRQLIQIPTGGGKTFIFLSYISKYIEKSLIIVPSRELLEQIYESSKHFLPKNSIYARKSSRWRQADHYLLTAQSLNFETTLDKILQNKFDVIIIDEAHRAQSSTYRKFIDEYIDKYPGTKILGLTATPERYDAKNLLEIFHKLTFSRSIYDMINQGHLCDMESYRIKTGQKFNTRKITGEDFSPLVLKELDNDSRNAIILKTFFDMCKDKKTIIFCVSVENAILLAKHFNASGISCEAIYGTLSYSERKLILQRYKSGMTQVITNCQLLTEGFDEPSIEAIIIARPTKSKTLYCQMIGRGLRKYPKKEVCYLHELTDNVHRICTFSTAANPEYLLESDYRNGIRLTELNKELQSIDIENIETVIEKISLFDESNYLNDHEASAQQIKKLESQNISYFHPITMLEAGFLIWKKKLEVKYGIDSKTR